MRGPTEGKDSAAGEMPPNRPSSSPQLDVEEIVRDWKRSQQVHN